ncbi:MAG: glucose-6-phosphate dehydrogenase [Pirellulales bacterium]|nr:glucose-6-phosphate dehydrogenase [Pirellulales bacterium]
MQHEEGMSIVVVGASGDLARKKIFPALFSLYCQGCLPERFQIFGFARSRFDHAEFRQRIMEHLTCRYAPGESCAARMEEFLARCFYMAGGYDSTDALLDLFVLMREQEGGGRADRFYYLAIPPSIFLDVARSIGNAGLVSCGVERPWSRVVLEKPFGHDRASSDMLAEAMADVFVEPQTYRIDHYLGKEVIQNLMVLRFANLVFEPVWNRRYIRNVKILWKENLSTEGRGGYFDQYGIIRDVCQNHLLQILSLVAMEPPGRFNAASIALEKVNVLRGVPPLTLDDVVLGQYVAGEHAGRRWAAYTDDPTVPDDSRTPTYAAARLAIDNDRWRGVPILIEAGKGLDARMTEIRVQFRDVPQDLFPDANGSPAANELVIRVQPDESIQLSIVNKVPGMGMKMANRNLDLRYKAAFSEQIPDAYESLLLDVMRGDRSLFIHREELQAAWDIFTPLLHEIDARRVVPQSYPFGASRPTAAEKLVP